MSRFRGFEDGPIIKSWTFSSWTRQGVSVKSIFPQRAIKMKVDPADECREELSCFAKLPIVSIRNFTLTFPKVTDPFVHGQLVIIRRRICIAIYCGEKWATPKSRTSSLPLYITCCCHRLSMMLPLTIRGTSIDGDDDEDAHCDVARQRLWHSSWGDFISVISQWVWVCVANGHRTRLTYSRGECQSGRTEFWQMAAIRDQV